MFVNVTLAILDVLIVTLLIYKTIMLFRGTRAFEILKGIAVLLIVWIISGLVGLDTVKFIISQLALYGILALIILFQPEIRNALGKLGRGNLSSYRNLVNRDPKLIDDIIQATIYMSKNKIGALISIELEDSLSEYIKTGVQLNSKISKELLINIFTPNVPLHDGAVIISGDRVEAASCYLPLTDKTDLPKDLGTRHRASIGLSEETDSLTIIVSEETGDISVAKDSQLDKGISIEQLRKYLENSLIQKKEKRKTLLKRGEKGE